MIREYVWQRPLLTLIGSEHRRLERQRYQPRFATALAIAIALIAGGFLVAALWQRAFTNPLETATRKIRLVPEREFQPPPSVSDRPNEPPRFTPAPPKLPSVPAAAIPIPVPEDETDVTTIASQQQMPFADATGDTGLGDSLPGGVPWGEPGGSGLVITDEAAPSPDEFIPVEEQPIVVEEVTPEYPHLAREAGLEGRVTIRALVSKDGRVQDAIIGVSVHALLDEAALAAAKKFIFKPAIQNGHPVAIWVPIPFNFTLQH